MSYILNFENSHQLKKSYKVSPVTYCDIVHRKYVKIDVINLKAHEKFKNRKKHLQKKLTVFKMIWKLEGEEYVLYLQKSYNQNVIQNI